MIAESQKYNILLVIVDCLRYDRVTPQYMPFLTEWGRQNTFFTNFWSVSHCTDPSITALLTGKFPDELRLYSMMYQYEDYTIPEDVEMLAQTAKKYGYSTGMISNIVRWYRRGVDRYIDNRGWHGSGTFDQAIDMMKRAKQPFFITVHDDSCHTNYRGGSYDRACAEVDTDLMRLTASVVEDDRLKNNTFIFITSDHGEGLGQHGIQQHGFGLWPMLTHVPLIGYFPNLSGGKPNVFPFQHTHVYRLLIGYITGDMPKEIAQPPSYAHLVGRVPNTWHRGVTDGRTMVIKEQDAKTGICNWTILNMHDGTHKDVRMDVAAQIGDSMWQEARKHAARFGIDADDDTKLDDAILEERLRSLGYFD